MLQLLLLLLTAPWLRAVLRLPPGGWVEVKEPLLLLGDKPPPAAATAPGWGDTDPLLGLLPSMRDKKLPEASSLPPLLSVPASSSK